MTPPPPAPPRRPRLLVFVIAYQAEDTLCWVLDRIPREVFETCECEVLVVDDGSADRTFSVGREYEARHPELPLTVLRNPYNQGYGGNQKIGYHYAIKHGFDFVAMVHGDGQYAPEVLPRLLEPLLAGRADAVFGSRMMTHFGALAGGMPLYKFAGNRILTFLQNRILGTRLSEFHSGYRIYSVPLLGRIPFRLNSNDFDFDTEIILQLFDAGARLVELPIPTYYGGEISRVNGLRYARDIMFATLRYRVHRAGLLYRRRFDTQTDPRYALKLGYPSSHTFALAAVPPGSRVLDCGAGEVGLDRELADKQCRVTTVSLETGACLDPRVRRVVADLDRALPAAEARDADVILMLDILEHLRNPEDLLERVRAQLDHRPRKVIVCAPNVAFAPIRLMLAIGQFNYGRAGILDLDHRRLFTFESLTRLLEDAGMRIERTVGVPAPFPRALGDGLLAAALMRINLALISLSRSLFSYQIFIEARTTPDLDFLLQSTLDSSARRVHVAEVPALTSEIDRS